MKRVLVCCLLLLPLVSARNVTEYEPATVVYWNETCEWDEELNRSSCQEVRVLVNIINVTENKTSFESEFSLFGERAKLDCRLRDIGEKTEYGRCYFDFPSEVWLDMLRYKAVPMPLGEIERSDQYWNTSLQECQKKVRRRGYLIFWGLLALVLTGVGVFVYLRWKRFGTRGR